MVSRLGDNTIVSNMTTKDYYEVLISLINKVDHLWAMFFASNAAIITWMLSTKTTVLTIYVILASLIFTAYSLMNCLAHLRAYKFLDLFLKEIHLNIDDLSLRSTELKERMKDLNYNNRYKITIISYTLSFLIINSLFWLRHGAIL